jgi:hypothetical protein
MSANTQNIARLEAGDDPVVVEASFGCGFCRPAGASSTADWAGRDTVRDTNLRGTGMTSPKRNRRNMR